MLVVLHYFMVVLSRFHSKREMRVSLHSVFHTVNQTS